MSIYSWQLAASNNATADAGINWSEGQAPSTINDSARAMMAALKAGFNDVAGVSALGGSGDIFALTLSQTMPSLTNAVVGFFATRTNTGAVTLNVDGLGAKPLRLVSGAALTAGQIVSGSFIQCAYNPATLEWLIVGKYALSNADLPAMAANTIKANLTGSSATPTDVTVAALGDALLPDGSLATVKIAAGAVTPAKLSTGGPSWDTSGNLTASGNVTAYSDARLKTNISTIECALALVEQMRGVAYERIDTGEKQVGVIAQEMRTVLPEVVIENEDGHLSVAYGNLCGVLIEAVKELSARVKASEAK
ncbi:MAG: Chaperone of endosialidase [Hyphomicrobiales bacterium]|nr:Chaperone of endosialidase [Hyphomicrobiales bacterium]